MSEKKKMFDNKLTSIREGLGFSIYYVAKQINESWEAVSRLEKGEYSNLRVEFIKKVCDFYKITPNDILMF